MTVTNKPFKYPGGCTVALGTFDGVHLGHRAVINTAIGLGLPVVVVTFAQNPQNILGETRKQRIMPLEYADSTFKALGVSAVIRLDFSEIKDMSPDEYLTMLTESIGAENIVFGYNFRFGKSAAGNADTARRFCRDRNIGIRICDAVTVGGDVVSSTRIRALIESGDMCGAAQLLGEPFTIYGEICHGDERGRTMGFPTVNQHFSPDDLLPKFGVYASAVSLDGHRYKAVTNVGIRPTFRTANATAETNIIGYSGDLYGRTVSVQLLKYIRGEIKFDSLSELEAQIKRDIAASQAFDAACGQRSAGDVTRP